MIWKKPGIRRYFGIGTICVIEMERKLAPGELLRLARAAGRETVVIGGGTGLSTLLLGLKEYTDNITAIVTVTDDGGGSGILRREFGMLPPGDVRNCILALADTSPLMGQVLNYRFTSGSLEGQNLGNLFLLALNEICGSFDGAVAAMNRILAVKGKVLPVSNRNLTLRAEFEDGSVVRGETAITAAKKQSGLRIRRVSLLPESAVALQSVIDAIDKAELIVLGPGSLYTSVIPNLLVGEVSAALRRSAALRVYSLNLMTQEGETEGYTAWQHVQEICAHAHGAVVDACVYNTAPLHSRLAARYAEEDSTQLFPHTEEFIGGGVKLLGGDMLSRGQLARHDPLRLAYHIMLAAEQFAPRTGEAGKYDRMLLSADEG